MVISYVFFILSFFLCMTILLFHKRRLDFISVYVSVMGLYSLPLFFNVVYNPYTGFMNNKPVEEVFIIMGIAFLFTIPFLLLNNSFQTNNKKQIGIEVNIQLFILSILILIGGINIIPNLLNSINKVEVLENSGNLLWRIFFEIFPVVCFIMSYTFKKYKLMFVFVFLILLNTFLGSRSSIVMSIVSFLLLSMGSRNIRLFQYYKILIVGFLGVVFVILSKTLYGYVLLHGFFEGFNIWIENFEWQYFFVGSEFMTTSTILNEVIIQDFDFDIESWIGSSLAIQPIPLSFFGLSSSVFNEEFQPFLFPNISYGMAYNPWAEAYATLGFVGVVLYSICIPSVLYILWYGYSKLEYRYSIICFIIGVLVAFWIHRNSLGSILAYIRNTFYPLYSTLLFSYLLTIMVKSVFKR